ncbi:hypothetical protein [Ferrovibrio sp.]|uniref:hypothetical protein n=1 Tax=Ferrovibrio sp. TaxID=1917215 RepID=UPI00311F11DE
MSVVDIIPRLPYESAPLGIGIGPVPQSRAEIVSAGQPSGVETMLQQLLVIRGELGGPDKARAEREAPLREFHGAPITYDGFAVARRPPTMSVYLLA